jgi:calcineurin-like phosphoesterase
VADEVLTTYKPSANLAILVDMHAEATSEKMAMGKYLDGRVSVVVGSHTHVPTDDARVLPKGTAYQTDGGMCGDYDSVIGFDAAAPLERFLSKISKGSKLEPAQGPATLRGLYVEIDDSTGLASSCKAFACPEK